MRAGDRPFFRAIGRTADLRDLERDIFRMAFIWKMNPFDLLERPISDIRKLLSMTNMISRERNAAYGRR